MIDLIAATTSTKGLKVHARLDETTYPRGVKVPDTQLAAVNLTRDEFHCEWNYTINPTATELTLPYRRSREREVSGHAWFIGGLRRGDG